MLGVKLNSDLSSQIGSSCISDDCIISKFSRLRDHRDLYTTQLICTKESVLKILSLLSQYSEVCIVISITPTQTRLGLLTTQWQCVCVCVSVRGVAYDRFSCLYSHIIIFSEPDNSRGTDATQKEGSEFGWRVQAKEETWSG